MAAQHADHIALRASDDGEGGPEHLFEAILQRFFSIHDRSGQPDALGLGLSVLGTLIEAMGGTVTLTSNDGWTVFTVRLPRRRRLTSSPLRSLGPPSRRNRGSKLAYPRDRDPPPEFGEPPRYPHRQTY